MILFEQQDLYNPIVLITIAIDKDEFAIEISGFLREYGKLGVVQHKQLLLTVMKSMMMVSKEYGLG